MFGAGEIWTVWQREQPMERLGGWTKFNFTEHQGGGHGGCREWQGGIGAGEFRLLWGALCRLGWCLRFWGAFPPPWRPQAILFFFKPFLTRTFTLRITGHPQHKGVLQGQRCLCYRRRRDRGHLLMKTVTIRLQHYKGILLASAGRWVEGSHPLTETVDRECSTLGEGWAVQHQEASGGAGH